MSYFQFNNLPRSCAYDVPFYTGFGVGGLLLWKQDIVDPIAMVSVGVIIYTVSRYLYRKYILDRWFITRKEVTWLETTKSTQFDELQNLLAKEIADAWVKEVKLTESVEHMSNSLAKRVITVIRREM